MIVVFLVAFVALLSFGIPIAIGLGGSAMVYLLFNPDIELTILPQTIFGGMASFPLLAIPLFMLAGNLMNEGGLTQDLVTLRQADDRAHQGRAGACHDHCLCDLCSHFRSRRRNGRSHRHDHDPRHETGRV